MKKLLSSLIVLLLLVACCLIAAFPASASDVNYDDYFIVDGMIIEYTGETEAEIVVPSVDADGNPIVRIDSRAFRNHTELTSVVISEGIESIGDETFEYCENLTEISLPYSLMESGFSALRKTSLYTLTIPGQLEVIPNDFAVAGQTLCELYISPGVDTIKSCAFYMTVSEIIFPESVYVIQGLAWNMVPSTVKTADIYILNGDCELGALSNKSAFYDQYGDIAPIVAPSYDGMTVKIYGPEDSAIKDYVNNDLKDMPLGKARFYGLDADEIDELEAKAEENGITEAPKVEDPDKDKDGDKEGNNKDDNKNIGTDTNNGGSMDMTLILILVVVVVLIIAIAVVVIVIVMNNNKKKKKKKKKAKKAAEAALKAAAEEAPAVAEEVAEEKGEEE